MGMELVPNANRIRTGKFEQSSSSSLDPKKPASSSSTIVAFSYFDESKVQKFVFIATFVEFVFQSTIQTL
uniref:Uncharacterized protein n=1 Tax=Romanomermis culicivorax TaxID=13658 RepID=A0A915JLN7_ROMCU